MTSSEKLGFYATPPHRCNYLPEQEAITLFADPNFPKNRHLYTVLAGNGFRRSGTHLYIPHCKHCSACISVRVSARTFDPSRGQKRTWLKNRDLKITELSPVFEQEHFELYSRYLSSRHPEGGMDNPTPESYMEFLTAPWTETVFYEMRAGDRLIAIAVTDVMNDGLSAVYTFYDPEESRRSPGKFAILYQIEQARLLGLEWLYLGYWIRQSSKMNYKSEYRPQQVYINNSWRDSIPDPHESSLPGRVKSG